MKIIKASSSIFIIVSAFLCGCSRSKIDKKGFQVNEISVTDDGKKIVGLALDSVNFKTQPRTVLKTGSQQRIIPVFKVNYTKDKGIPFIGSLGFHSEWQNEARNGINWHNHIVPGFSAAYGYNLVNIALHHVDSKKQNKFFHTPTLIKTLYFPSFKVDTLQSYPIFRDFFMVSAYDEDTNKDGFINAKDLRRLYHFNLNGEKVQTLVPKSYAVMSSQYDEGLDYFYVYAKLDENNNGQIEVEEPTTIFWINLKDPNQKGMLYKPSSSN